MPPRVRKRVVIKRTMFKDVAISTIVRMTCDGCSMAEIVCATGHPAGKVRNLLNEVRYEMGLPKLRRDFVEYKHLVIENLLLWEDHHRQVATMQLTLRSSVHNLNTIID